MNSYLTGMKTDLSTYNNSWYKKEIGASAFKQICWYYANFFVLNGYLFPFSTVKVWLLRLFGARIGQGVVIKPKVNIKYPWKLSIGDHCWLGEEVWIDNLAQVTIGAHVSISQGAFILTGNHNYRKPGFDLMVEPVVLEDGVWIGAKAIVCPGITCKHHAVLAVASVATNDLESYSIYQGNPAVVVKNREIISV